MKLTSSRILTVAILLLCCRVACHAQRSPMPERVANRSHPIAIKTDLMGVRSHSLSLEGEVRLFWRVSAFAQGGIIQGFRPDWEWRSHGYIGRAGLKFYLGSKEATRMTGFAIRTEAAIRNWKSRSGDKTHDQRDVAGFLGISYTWNPFDRFIVEPCLGLGMSSWRESFSETSLIDNPSGIPHTPWIRLGRQYRGDGVYDDNGDLVALEGGAWPITIGLLIGIRL